MKDAIGAFDSSDTAIKQDLSKQLIDELNNKL